MNDIKIHAISTFLSWFHVGRNKGNAKYKRSPSAWLIFTLQPTALLKDINRHPRVSGVLAQSSCRLIHHQWAIDKVETVCLGFFVGETPT
jgi:hypothetical protein